MIFRDIIREAFRENNTISLTKIPNEDEERDALSRLNRLIQSWVGTAVGEYLNDWYVPELPQLDVSPVDPRDPFGENTSIQIDYPPINHRIVLRLTDDRTIFFPQYPNDGSRMLVTDSGSESSVLTIDGAGRKIEGQQTISLNPLIDAKREWFFRADKSEWVLMSNFTLDSESPFPDEFDDLLVTGLALRLAPGFGQTPNPVTLEVFRTSLSNFKARYKQYTEVGATYDISELQSVGQNYLRNGGSRFQGGTG